MAHFPFKLHLPGMVALPVIARLAVTVAAAATILATASPALGATADATRTSTPPPVPTGSQPSASGRSTRTRLFMRLPDWGGIWATEAAAAAASGAGLRQAEAGAAQLPLDYKHCGPIGFPTVLDAPLPDIMFELLVTPEQTLFISTDGTVRHIYTDGRSHPKPQDLWPTPTGDSIGHWDGGTLVIDTIAREAGPIVPFPGSPNLSAAAHFTERLRRVDANTLEDAMTIEDPGLKQPWRSTTRFTRVRDVDRLMPVDCEHDRNPVVGGKTVIAPPR